MKTNYYWVLLVAPALCQSSDVFRWTDERGNIHFGDNPGVNEARPVELKPPTTYSPPDYSAPGLLPPQEQKQVEQVDVTNYQISILSPLAEQTYRDASGVIPFHVQTTPPVAGSNLKYQFFLDGGLVAEGSQNGIQLTGVDRGAHQVKAILVDENGKVRASSPEVTFYLQKVSIKKNKP